MSSHQQKNSRDNNNKNPRSLHYVPGSGRAGQNAAVLSKTAFNQRQGQQQREAAEAAAAAVRRQHRQYTHRRRLISRKATKMSRVTAFIEQHVLDTSDHFWALEHTREEASGAVSLHSFENATSLIDFISRSSQISDSDDDDNGESASLDVNGEGGDDGGDTGYDGGDGGIGRPRGGHGGDRDRRLRGRRTSHSRGGGGLQHHSRTSSRDSAGHYSSSSSSSSSDSEEDSDFEGVERTCWVDVQTSDAEVIRKVLERVGRAVDPIDILPPSPVGLSKNENNNNNQSSPTQSPSPPVVERIIAHSTMEEGVIGQDPLETLQLFPRRGYLFCNVLCQRYVQPPQSLTSTPVSSPANANNDNFAPPPPPLHLPASSSSDTSSSRMPSETKPGGGTKAKGKGYWGAEASDDAEAEEMHDTTLTPTAITTTTTTTTTANANNNPNNRSTDKEFSRQQQAMLADVPVVVSIICFDEWVLTFHRHPVVGLAETIHRICDDFTISGLRSAVNASSSSPSTTSPVPATAAVITPTTTMGGRHNPNAQITTTAITNSSSSSMGNKQSSTLSSSALSSSALLGGGKRQIKQGHKKKKGKNIEFMTSAWVLSSLLQCFVETVLPDIAPLLTEADAIDEMVLYVTDEHGDLLKRMAATKRQLSMHRAVLFRKERFIHQFLTPGAQRLRRVRAGDGSFRGMLADIHFSMERLEAARDILSQANANLVASISLHAALVGNQMNAQMKLLSQVATVCLPMTIVTGAFGMNVLVPAQTGTGEHWSNSLTPFMLICFLLMGWLMISIPYLVRADQALNKKVSGPGAVM